MENETRVNRSTTVLANVGRFDCAEELRCTAIAVWSYISCHPCTTADHIVLRPHYVSISKVDEGIRSCPSRWNVGEYSFGYLDGQAGEYAD